MAYKESTIFDKIEDEGSSPIYVGISYLKIVASQMDFMRKTASFAYKDKGDYLFIWLNEMRTFYDLIESRTGIPYSNKEINFFEYKFEDNILKKCEIKIKEKQKYIHWFNEIESMIERNWNVKIVGGGINPFKEKRYLNEKEILSELSKCMRSLMRDANDKNLIMPEGQKDWKTLAKNDWIDRDQKKEF